MGGSENPDNNKPFDGYSPIAKGYLLGTMVLTATLVAVIPIIGGTEIDKRFQTAPLFTLLGIGLGFFAMITQLIRIVKKV